MKQGMAWRARTEQRMVRRDRCNGAQHGGKWEGGRVVQQGNSACQLAKIQEESRSPNLASNHWPPSQKISAACLPGTNSRSCLHVGIDLLKSESLKESSEMLLAVKPLGEGWGGWCKTGIGWLARRSGGGATGAWTAWMPSGAVVHHSECGTARRAGGTVGGGHQSGMVGRYAKCPFSETTFSRPIIYRDKYTVKNLINSIIFVIICLIHCALEKMEDIDMNITHIEMGGFKIPSPII